KPVRDLSGFEAEHPEESDQHEGDGHRAGGRDYRELRAAEAGESFLDAVRNRHTELIDGFAPRIRSEHLEVGRYFAQVIERAIDRIIGGCPLDIQIEYIIAWTSDEGPALDFE